MVSFRDRDNVLTDTAVHLPGPAGQRCELSGNPDATCKYRRGAACDRTSTTSPVRISPCDIEPRKSAECQRRTPRSYFSRADHGHRYPSGPDLHDAFIC